MRDGITIVYDPAVTEEEIVEAIAEAKEFYAERRQVPELLDIQIDGEELVIIRKPKSGKIYRTRRITGYLSNLDNFNTAKRAEEADRRGIQV